MLSLLLTSAFKKLFAEHTSTCDRHTDSLYRKRICFNCIFHSEFMNTVICFSMPKRQGWLFFKIFIIHLLMLVWITVTTVVTSGKARRRAWAAARQAQRVSHALATVSLQWPSLPPSFKPRCEIFLRLALYAKRQWVGAEFPRRPKQIQTSKCQRIFNCFSLMK